jgi:hypothetical protein
MSLWNKSRGKQLNFLSSFNYPFSLQFPFFHPSSILNHITEICMN